MLFNAVVQPLFNMQYTSNMVRTASRVERLGTPAPPAAPVPRPCACGKRGAPQQVEYRSQQTRGHRAAPRRVRTHSRQARKQRSSRRRPTGTVVLPADGPRLERADGERAPTNEPRRLRQAASAICSTARHSQAHDRSFHTCALWCTPTTRPVHRQLTSAYVHEQTEAPHWWLHTQPARLMIVRPVLLATLGAWQLCALAHTAQQ